MQEIQLFAALSAALDAQLFQADPAAVPACAGISGAAPDALPEGFVPFADLMAAPEEDNPALPLANEAESTRETDREPAKDPVQNLIAMLAQVPAIQQPAAPAPVDAPRVEKEKRPAVEESAAPVTAAEAPPVQAEAAPMRQEASRPALPQQALHEMPASAAPHAIAMHAAAPIEPPSSPAPVASAHVPSPVGTPRWREELGAQVTLLATERVQSAEIRVEPAELGPVHVQLRIEANEATITLVAEAPETRQALEDALPQLREMLEAGGVQVGETSVGDSSREHPRHAAYAQPGALAAGTPEEVRAPAARANGLVDVFA